MAIRYYYGVTGNLNTVNNWYSSYPSSPLGSLPTSSDTVVFLSNLTDTTTVSTYNILSANNVTLIGGQNSSITLTTSGAFTGSSVNSFIINGNVYFYNNSTNTGTINGTAFFNNFSYNASGGIYTNALFYSISSQGVNSSFMIL